MKPHRLLLLALSLSVHGTGFSQEVDQAAELAKQLSNPVASLISVPMQANWDFGIGVNDATRFTLNVQPVIPISLNEDVNLIIRTIMPVIDAESPAPGIPSAGMVTMVMVLQSVGLPAEAVAILIPIDRVLDTVRTAVNVEGDLITSLVVDKWAGKDV